MDRELDAEVARLVMGYEGEPFDFVTSDGKSMSAWVDRRDGPWYSRHDLEVWLKEHQDKGRLTEYRIEQTYKFPKYTTDTAADYSVLEHVRETWDGGRCDAFGHELERIWMGRKNDCSFLPTCCRYTPGDYSRAALAVVKAKQHWGRVMNNTDIKLAELVRQVCAFDPQWREKFIEMLGEKICLHCGYDKPDGRSCNCTRDD